MKHQQLGTMNVRGTLMSFADNLWKGAPELPAGLNRLFPFRSAFRTTEMIFPDERPKARRNPCGRGSDPSADVMLLASLILRTPYLADSSAGNLNADLGQPPYPSLLAPIGTQARFGEF